MPDSPQPVQSFAMPASLSDSMCPLSLALFLATHAPERGQPKITEGQTEAERDQGAPRADFARLILSDLSTQRDGSNASHRKENKASNLQPKLVENTAERAQRNAPRLQYSVQGTMLSGMLARQLGENT